MKPTPPIGIRTARARPVSTRRSVQAGGWQPPAATERVRRSDYDDDLHAAARARRIRELRGLTPPANHTHTTTSRRSTRRRGAGSASSRASTGPGGVHANHRVLYKSPMMRGAVKEHEPQLSALLSRWDSGSERARAAILRDFVSRYRGATGPELEAEFGLGASLLLTRVSAWLRLSFLFGRLLKLKLDAVTVFVSASSGQRYLSEFLEVGGVITVLAVLNLGKAREADKRAALELLLLVSRAGRAYKELVCEGSGNGDGVVCVAQCMANAREEATQELARNLIHDLGLGNPTYLPVVRRALLYLLPSAGPTAQRLASQALRLLIPRAPPNRDFVNPILLMLRTLDFQVQYEAIELCKLLIVEHSLHAPLLEGLIALLKPSRDVLENAHVAHFGGGPGAGGSRGGGGAVGTDRRRRAADNFATPSLGGSTRFGAGRGHANGGSGRSGGGGGGGEESTDNKPWLARASDQQVIPAAFPQQAAAAKILGVLPGIVTAVGGEMLEMGGLQGLLFALTNVHYYESQRQALDTILVLFDLFPFVERALQTALPPVLFREVFSGNEEALKMISMEDREILIALSDSLVLEEEEENVVDLEYRLTEQEIQRQLDDDAKARDVAGRDADAYTQQLQATPQVPAERGATLSHSNSLDGSDFDDEGSDGNSDVKDADRVDAPYAFAELDASAAQFQQKALKSTNPFEEEHEAIKFFAGGRGDGAESSITALQEKVDESIATPKAGDGGRVVFPQLDKPAQPQAAAVYSEQVDDRPKIGRPLLVNSALLR